MTNLSRQLRSAGLAMLIVGASVAAAGQGSNTSGQGAQKSPEEVQRELIALMDALPRLHPMSAELASRAAGVKARLELLTPEQLATMTPVLSSSDFTAVVERLTATGLQNGPIALLSPLPGAEYDSCGSTRSDTDSGRDLVIASDSVNIAAIIGDVACNSIVVILGEGTNLPACIVAGVLHEAVQAIDFERDLRGYCDSVIDGNEIRGILNNSTVIHDDLELHDVQIKAALAQHDADIKALLATLQRGVDEANQRLKVSEALERQTIKLLLTPEGLREVDPNVLTCTGDNCPRLVVCPGPECSFPIRRR